MKTKASMRMNCLTKQLTIAASLMVSGFFSPVTIAEVQDSTADGFTIGFTKTIAADTEQVYRALTTELPAWWIDAHTWYGSGENMHFDTHVGGCLCEKSTDRQTMHMQIAKLEPSTHVRLLGGLGPLQGEGVTGVMDWRLAVNETEPEKTTLTVMYRVGGYTPSDLSQWANAVDGVLQQQMSAMQTYAEQQIKDK